MRLEIGYRRQKLNDLRWSVLKIYDHATHWAGSIIMYWIDIQISLVWNIIMLILLTRYNQFIMAGWYWNSYRNNIIRIAAVVASQLHDTSFSDLCLCIIMHNFVFFWTSILTVVQTNKYYKYSYISVWMKCYSAQGSTRLLVILFYSFVSYH